MRGVRAVYGTCLRSKYGAAGVVLKLIALAAARLKAHQLATQPTAEAGLTASRWLLVAAFEIFLGLCLVSGVLARTVWLVAMGCFGTVKVNPWYTCELDAAAVAALLLWPPCFSQISKPSRERPTADRLAALVSAQPACLFAGEGPRSGSATRVWRVEFYCVAVGVRCCAGGVSLRCRFGGALNHRENT